MRVNAWIVGPLGVLAACAEPAPVTPPRPPVVDASAPPANSDAKPTLLPTQAVPADAATREDAARATSLFIGRPAPEFHGQDATRTARTYSLAESSWPLTSCCASSSRPISPTASVTRMPNPTRCGACRRSTPTCSPSVRSRRRRPRSSRTSTACRSRSCATPIGALAELYDVSDAGGPDGAERNAADVRHRPRRDDRSALAD
jgi:hypothetical protein